MADEPFWRRKTLAEMTRSEWESLCDGCAKCCLDKLQDDDTGEISYTEVACRLLDLGTCRCTDYANRKRFVPDCVVLTPRMVARLTWLPSSCAYRLISEGRDLEWWHPLVSGDPETVHRAGVSVRGRAVPEALAGDLEDHIVHWPEQGENP
ncbi:MAG: YcgN family cysteine cluster protein [Proteobacteria bacterium]|nr:YcgN family cysteine cluster protein [Pseudomonadota bacterium]